LSKILHGTPEEIISKIKDYKRIGVDHLILFFPLKQEVEQMKLMAEKIIPKI